MTRSVILISHTLHSTIGLAALSLMISALAPSALWAANGPELFSKNCASCHGKDGKGQTIMGQKWGIKDLKTSTLAEAEVTRQIKEGKEDVNKGSKMPPFRDKLDDEEIKAIASYVVGLRK